MSLDPIHREPSETHSDHPTDRPSGDDHSSHPICPSCRNATSLTFQFNISGRTSTTYRCPDCGAGVTEIRVSDSIDRNPRLESARRLLEYGVGGSGRRVAALLGSEAPQGEFRVYRPAPHMAIIEHLSLRYVPGPGFQEYIRRRLPSDGVSLHLSFDNRQSRAVIVERDELPVSRIFYHNRGEDVIEIGDRASTIQQTGVGVGELGQPSGDPPSRDQQIPVEGSGPLHEVVATVDELDCSADRTVRAMKEPMEVLLHI